MLRLCHFAGGWGFRRETQSGLWESSFEGRAQRVG